MVQFVCAQLGLKKKTMLQRDFVKLIRLLTGAQLLLNEQLVTVNE